MKHLSLLLFSAFILVTGLSLVLKRLVKRHLDEKYAIFSHLFVGLIAVYYLTDLLLGEYSQRATFAVFWMGIIVSQAGFWIKAKMK